MIFFKIGLAYCILWFIWWFVVPSCKIIFLEAKYDMKMIGTMHNFGPLCYKMTHNGKEIEVFTDFTTHKIKKIRHSFYDFYDFILYSIKRTIAKAESDPSMLVMRVYYNHYLVEEKRS